MEEMENVDQQPEEQFTEDPGYEDQDTPEDSLEDLQEEEVENTDTEVTEENEMEDLEADPEEVSEDEESEDQQEEPEESIVESISGNDVMLISGNAVIFPEDFDYSMFQSSTEGEIGNYDDLVEVVEYQTNLIFSVSVVISFMLGVIAGILFIHGFRLRRV